VPETKCMECDQTHRAGPRHNRTKYCIYHDRDNYVDKRLIDHRGLPLDCPGCLGHGTIEKRPYGKRAGDYTLTCRGCGTVYHWSEK
jgi:hypothetical protein